MVPFIRPNAYGNEKKLGSSLILHGDIPVQTKLFVSEHKQRKVCLSVESKDLFFSCRVAKGSTKRNGAGEKKKQQQTFQSNKSSFCEELPARRNGAHMRHRFNPTLQVTGLPDAAPLAPCSPYLITHTQTHARTLACRHTHRRPNNKS